VLGAGFPTTLVTADVTLRTWMGPGDVERLEAAPGTLAPALGEMLRVWGGAQKKLFTVWGGAEPPDFAAFLHDPLTALAMVDPSSLRLERLRILPTIVRNVLRTLESREAGNEMAVATDVDPAAARRAIVDRLARV
jgi:inosine-uridine nucleoside N-ribohydrolase